MIYFAVFVVLLIIGIIIALVLASKRYGLPDVKEGEKLTPKNTPATIDELKNEPILFPKQFIADVRSVVPDCSEEKIMLLWCTGDFQTFSNIYNTTKEDLDWLKQRYKFHVESTKRVMRLKKDLGI